MPFRTPNHRKIKPKLSSIPPRPSQEATLYLYTYKKIVEKQRLQQELQKLEIRRNQIQQRLAILEEEIAAQQEKITRQEPNSDQILVCPENPPQFHTLTWEY